MPHFSFTPWWLTGLLIYFDLEYLPLFNFSALCSRLPHSGGPNRPTARLLTAMRLSQLLDSLYKKRNHGKDINAGPQSSPDRRFLSLSFSQVSLAHRGRWCTAHWQIENTTDWKVHLSLSKGGRETSWCKAEHNGEGDMILKEKDKSGEKKRVFQEPWAWHWNKNSSLKFNICGHK